MTIKDYHEQQFFNALNDIFVGAKIEGESGYINLMAIKSRYYTQGVFPQLKKDIAAAIVDFPEFREELFDKLYSFFQRYFSESGSIYFRHTPLHQNVYEKVYTDDRDVVLFWKTHMLYYVKTDRLFKSMAVEVDEQKFWFDASQVELKRSNEKREVVFAYREKRADGTLVFEVSYSERGSKTKVEDVLKALKKDRLDLSDEILNKAFRVFEKQSEVDFFINKDARSFLREQFDLWMYQYLFEGQNVWSAERLAQLQALKDVAYKVIDFISQFEDELVKIWNKPKFVRNSHYVITFDKLAGSPVVEKLLAHPNIAEQIEEWRELGMIGEDFRLGMLTQTDLTGAPLHPQYQHLPVDTKFFTDLELEILALFEDLEAALDGWLVHSENYQALNTLLPKFTEKVQTIYIDPPFNTGDDFAYVDKFQDATWLSLMNERISISKSYLSNRGHFLFHIDKNAYFLSRLLLNTIFGGENFKAEVAWDTCGITGFKPGKNNWVNNINYILHFAKDNSRNTFTKLYSILNKNERDIHKLGWLDLLFDDETGQFFYERWDRNLEKHYIETEEKKHPIGMVWNDIYSFLFTQVANNESFFFNTQKPEHLLRRLIQSTAKPREIVFDFFSGIGTSISVAHKLNRKWIGVEMGEHFHTFYSDNCEIKIGILGRLKITLFGDQLFFVFGHPRHPQLSRNINWQGGGFFKYYDLEQYEEVLQKAHYEDSDLFNDPNQDPYTSYVFLRDLKMLESLEIDQENNRVRFHPERLYPDIDLAETFSHLTGKWIRRITKDYVEFEDGEQMSLTDPDWQVLKPMIWWQ